MTVIIFLASLFSCLITYFATQDLFKKQKPDGTPKKTVASKETVFLICLAGLVVLPLLQTKLQEKADEKKESEIKAHYDSSLIANTLKIKSGFDSGNDKQTEILSNTLGKYGYSLDAANKRLVRLIKDSSKTIEPEVPTFYINSIKVSKNNNLYPCEVVYVSDNATSRDFNLKISILTTDLTFTHPHYFSTWSPLDYDDIINTKNGIKKTFTIHSNKIDPYILLWLRGTYKNQHESQTFPINTIYYVSYPVTDLGIVSDTTKERIINFIKSQKNKD